MSQCSILACQVSVPETRSCDDRDNHVDRISELISQKLSVQCSDLVVLPELSTVEYSRQSFSILKSLAETLDGRSVRVWQEVAKKYSCHIVFGMPRIQDDQYRISQIVIDSNGNVGGYYDKLQCVSMVRQWRKTFFHVGESCTYFP